MTRRGVALRHPQRVRRGNRPAGQRRPGDEPFAEHSASYTVGALLLLLACKGLALRRLALRRLAEQLPRWSHLPGYLSRSGSRRGPFASARGDCRDLTRGDGGAIVAVGPRTSARPAPAPRLMARELIPGG